MTLDVKNQGIIRDSMFHPEQDMNANKNVIGPVVVNIFQLCFNSLKPRHVASSRHFDLFLCCPRFLGEVNKIRTLGIFLLLDVKYATQLLLGVSLLAVFFDWRRHQKSAFTQRELWSFCRHESEVWLLSSVSRSHRIKGKDHWWVVSGASGAASSVGESPRWTLDFLTFKTFKHAHSEGGAKYWKKHNRSPLNDQYCESDFNSVWFSRGRSCCTGKAPHVCEWATDSYHWAQLPQSTALITSRTDIGSLRSGILNSGQTGHWSPLKSNRSWEPGRPTEPSPPSIHPVFLCSSSIPSSRELVGWSVVVASSQRRPILSPAIHHSFACLLYLISANIPSFPSIPPSWPSAPQQLLASVHFPTLCSTLVTPRCLLSS